MLSIFATFLAGLGLFFTGVHLVSRNFKQMSGRRFRLAIARWTDRDWQSSGIGLVAGALLQSTSALTFIIIGMISSGLITVRRALPIIVWANIGVSALVFLAVLDIELLVLFLLGAAGLAYAFNKPARYASLVGVLLGIGLLFLGLGMMQSGAAPLREFAWFESVLLNTRESYFLGLLVGAGFSILTQSAAAISIVAITMTTAGLFTFEQTMMIIYGANVGSSIMTAFLSAGMKGTGKQFAAFQIGFNFTGALLFVPLFYVEQTLGIPLIQALAQLLSSSVEQQMAFVYLFFNLFTGLVLLFLYSPIARLLSRTWPPTTEEDESKMAFIHDQAHLYPESALDLIHREQLRLMKRLPAYMDLARKSRITEAIDTSSLESRHSAFSTVAGEVQACLGELVDQSLDSATSALLLNIQNRHCLVQSIEENVFRIISTLETNAFEEPATPLIHGIVEGLDALLLITIDALESGDSMDLELLQHATQDRSDNIESIRKTYLYSENGLELNSKTTILYITSLFERSVWMLNRLSRLLNSERPSAQLAG